MKTIQKTTGKNCQIGGSGTTSKLEDLHQIAPRQLIDKYTATEQSHHHEQVEDEWSDQHGIRVLQDGPWTGHSVFFKQDAKEAKPNKIHSSLCSSRTCQVKMDRSSSTTTESLRDRATVADDRCRLEKVQAQKEPWTRWQLKDRLSKLV